jgi:hypothetical protein
MRKALFLLLFALLLLPVAAQDKIPVLTLGTFHFSFPNLDKVQYADDNQIDVLEPKYQDEINDLVSKLAKFKPTIIVIERPHKAQTKIDSLYQEYIAGKYDLKRSEDQQIGFRLAKKMGIKKLYCVDEWGNTYDKIEKLLDDESTKEYINFEKSFSEHPDSIKAFEPKSIFKEKGIIAELLELNKKENVEKSLGNYLIGHFKYESAPFDYTGVDFETGRWFNRNLRIFRNIQRVDAKPSDRILVIFGAGHLNLLNYLFECSPEYRLEDVCKYLR